MVTDMINWIVTWLKVFPMSGGIQGVSPRALVVGTALNYQQHCRCPFGAYVQTHEETDNDTDRPRTLDAICLGPTGNTQGTYKFLNLSTGRRIYRRKWTELPAPDWVIKRVNELGKKDKMEQLWVFRNRNKEPIADEDTDNNTIDDGIIASDITEEAQQQLIDEGVNDGATTEHETQNIVQSENNAIVPYDSNNDDTTEIRKLRDQIISASRQQQ